LVHLPVFGPFGSLPDGGGGLFNPADSAQPFLPDMGFGFMDGLSDMGLAFSIPLARGLLIIASAKSEMR
jgi:hypothetical protein